LPRHVALYYFLVPPYMELCMYINSVQTTFLLAYSLSQISMRTMLISDE